MKKVLLAIPVIILVLLGAGCGAEVPPFHPVDGNITSPAQYIEYQDVSFRAIELIEDTNGEALAVLYLEKVGGTGEVSMRTQVKVVNLIVWVDRYYSYDLKLELVHDDVYQIIELET